MSMGIFNEMEQELIDAARLIMRDGVERLKGRDALFPTTRERSRTDRIRLNGVREALADSLQMEYGALRHEVALAVLIDAQGRLITIEQFPQGKAAHVEISARILAGWIVHHGAVAVLLAHNHPSGECAPSKQDIAVTDHLVSWLRVMDCELIDHLVLTGSESCSILGNWI